MTHHVAPDRDLGLQGKSAGLVTRGLAFLIDAVMIIVVYDLIVRLLEILVSTISGRDFNLAHVPAAPWVLLIVVGVLYCIGPVIASGHTLGMTIVGLRVIRPDGTDVGLREAVVRLLALPLSFLTLGYGFLLILLRRDGRALHDLVAHTSVVYGWDARAARLRFLVREESGH